MGFPSLLLTALRTPEPGVELTLRWWRWGALIFFSLHLLVTALTMPFRWDHLALAGIFIGLAWAGPHLRRMSFYCLPFGLTAMAYDNLRFITHLRGTICAFRWGPSMWRTCMPRTWLYSG